MKTPAIDEQRLFWINSSEMDFLTAVEAEYSLPIAFKDRAALDRWIDEDTELTRNALGRRNDEADVLLLDGLLKPWPLTKADVGQGLFYRQIWVRVDYRGYRGAIKFAIEQSEGSYKSMDLYDGDHAVGQNRLARLWPVAWVNLVLVERGVNRAIGSMLEKEPLEEPDEPDCITINAESILKAFYDRGDQKMELSKVREYLGQARQRFITFQNELRGSFSPVEVGTLDRLAEFVMSENAWNFFDDFARNLKVAYLDRPPSPILAFSRLR